VEIFSRVLREYGVARNTIQREVESIRKEGYQLLRLPAQTRVEVTDVAELLESASTETLSIESDFSAVGRTLGELDVRKATGATVIAAVRSGATIINPGPDFELMAQDIIVLLGSPEAIERAIEKISSPRIDPSRR
ncbi:MAG TPA: TrkA C-terminal domain-containing protein, partial [Blastocatellia bacterium]